MSESAQLVWAIGTLFGTLATLVATIGSVWIGLRNTKKITEIHDATNGLVAKLGGVSRSQRPGRLADRDRRVEDFAVQRRFFDVFDLRR